MKLGDIMQRAGTARPITPHPVEFTAKGENHEFVAVKAKVPAAFVFLDEDQRTRIQVQARASVAERFKDAKDIPPSVYRDEETYYLLFEALREAEPNAEGRYDRLCASVLELRHALVLVEAQRLYAAYTAYVASEFPEHVSDEDYEKMVGDAKTLFLPDLLTSYGFGKVVALASSLAGLSPR